MKGKGLKLPELKIPEREVKVAPPSAPRPVPVSGLVSPRHYQPGEFSEYVLGPPRLSCGFADSIGTRDAMEDKIVIFGGFRHSEDYFGLFDGHGGDSASKYCAAYLHQFLLEGLSTMETSGALSNAFNESHNSMKVSNIKGGTTSLVVYFTGDNFYVANCGDSRCVLSKSRKALRLSVDHKPEGEEKQRIEDLGGWVQGKRVMSQLAVARSLGDFSLEPYVSHQADIFGPFQMNQNNDLLIMACDGLWDVMTDEEAVEIALKCSNARDAATTLRDVAMDRCTKDNVSCIVIHFDGFRPVA